MALERDPLHAQARELWELLQGAGATVHTSVPVGMEGVGVRARVMTILNCERRDLEQAWEYFRRADLHKLSAVDATSYAIMKRARIRIAYSFDHHFAAVGFRLVT